MELFMTLNRNVGANKMYIMNDRLRPKAEIQHFAYSANSNKFDLYSE